MVHVPDRTISRLNTGSSPFPDNSTRPPEDKRIPVSYQQNTNIGVIDQSARQAYNADDLALIARTKPGCISNYYNCTAQLDQNNESQAFQVQTRKLP